MPLDAAVAFFPCDPRPGYNACCKSAVCSESFQRARFESGRSVLFLDAEKGRVLKVGRMRVATAEGRDVRLLTITGPPITGPPVTDPRVTDPRAGGGRRSVWIVGIQHCAETGAGWGIEGLAEYLLSDDARAERARRELVVKLVPIVNVDGVAEGRGRLHPRNLNLNREWEKEHPAAEVAAIRGAMDAWTAAGGSIDLVLDIHGFSAVPDRNWVLLPLAAGSCRPAVAELAGRYERRLCGAIPFRIAPSPQQGYAAGMAARRFGCPAFSIDGYVFRWPTVGTSPDLAAHYEEGCEVWPLEQIKAAGRTLMEAVLDCMLGE